MGHRLLHRHGDPSSFSTPQALPQSPLLAMRGIAVPCQEAKRGTFKESQSPVPHGRWLPCLQGKGQRDTWVVRDPWLVHSGFFRFLTLNSLPFGYLHHLTAHPGDEEVDIGSGQELAVGCAEGSSCHRPDDSSGSLHIEVACCTHGHSP